MNFEAQLKAFLSLHFENVFADSPNPEPDTYITFERTGGKAGNVIVDEPQVAIQCYAPTRYAASQLAKQVWDTLPLITSFAAPFTRVEREGMYNFPLEHRPRYQIVATFTVADY